VTVGDVGDKMFENKIVQIGMNFETYLTKPGFVPQSKKGRGLFLRLLKREWTGPRLKQSTNVR